MAGWKMFDLALASGGFTKRDSTKSSRRWRHCLSNNRTMAATYMGHQSIMQWQQPSCATRISRMPIESNADHFCGKLNFGARANMRLHFWRGAERTGTRRLAWISVRTRVHDRYVIDGVRRWNSLFSLSERSIPWSPTRSRPAPQPMQSIRKKPIKLLMVMRCWKLSSSTTPRCDIRMA